MAHVIKKGSIKVPTQPKDYDLQATGLVFKSYDNQIALEFNVEQQNGTPADLLGANLRLLMFIYDEVDGMITKEPIPFITKNLITESFLNGQVVYILPEAMKAYNGMVEAYVYIEYPDGSTSDNLGFTFRMKRSAIDGLAQDKADYFIADFQQLLDGVKQKVDQKIAESETQIDAKLKDTNDKIAKANQDVATLNTNIDKANDRIDQTNQQIGDLGKLKKMYSNSIDFGGYDYSGNPNIAPVINDNNVKSLSSTTTTVTNHGTYATAEKIGNDLTVGVGIFPWNRYDFSKLTVGKQYTLTIPIRINADYTGDISKLFIRIRCTNTDGWVLVNTKMLPANTPKDKLVDISTTFTVPSTVQNSNNWYCQVGSLGDSDARGTVDIGYDVKLEEGTTATPYQPNLLDAPYYLSKVALGENIADPKVKFPITTTQYPMYIHGILKKWTLGKTYSVTMKATKPATQKFYVYLASGSIGVGSMTPVEGLADVWTLTFTVQQDHIDQGADKVISIYQYPTETKGEVKIDWLKVEESDTRTPNISQFKYFGEGLKDSNNPNDYSWDVTPEYTEKGLNDSVSLTEPQSVDGTKNFLETPLVNGKNVLVEEKPLPYEAWHSTGTEQTGISNKARLIIGPVATTIGEKLNRFMKENPLTWNSGNWQATANRDCTLLVEGLVRYQFGGSTAGQYGYITFYKDDAQTSSIGFAGGVGMNGTALQWKHGLHFSRIFALKKGEYFNITFETQDGKKLDFSQINTLHIMEIES
ncbi:BppU family phage baseplate upper protein [Enterococcus faecium]|uniref:BppU family phage baseplate upper protein n=1 Tax=Enterococcus faecium TaxID=1352 RepID=UPI001F312A10|nr:BppU family phage baseplate upper protein [Enterococcus faecium]UJM30738.1 BppU family phage baseplate upper protein [Enterococcus faecium]